MGKGYKYKFSDNYDVLIPFRCTHAMYQYICDESFSRGISKSDFIRICINTQSEIKKGFEPYDNR